MTNAFDPRIVKVGIQIEGDVITFQDLDIRIEGQKYFDSILNSCTIKISNLTRAQLHHILTRSSPIIVPSQQRHPSAVTVDIGRESYGTFRLFEGLVYTSDVTIPPDIGITFNSIMGSGFLSMIEGDSQGAIVQLKTIAQAIANKGGLILDFDAKQRQIANFSLDGSVQEKIEQLKQVGNIRVCQNNKVLIVRDKDGFTKDLGFVLSEKTGMVGVPQATESGCRAVMLASPSVDIGDKITVHSEINPSVNGKDYYISQIKFDIANRDTPFFYTLSLSAIPLANGTA